MQAGCQELNYSVLFPVPCLDGDPKEARKQELGGLHGALQGEQVSECEERLRHHPFLSRNEFHLRGQDDHPPGQAEHGQRLDVTLKKKNTPQNKPCRSELSSTSHSLLLLYPR